MDGLSCIIANSAKACRLTLGESMPAEYVALNTCERHELYTFARSIDAPAVTADGLELTGKVAADHLLRVAAGLDSRIVGEPHVLGQVRRAFADAESQRTSGTMLAALFRSALRAGRRVRSETALNAAGESVVTLATRRLVDALDSLHSRRIGIVGTGEVANGLVRALTFAGVRELVVFSRSENRIREANRWERTAAMPLSALSGVIPNLDALVACSHVQEPVLGDADFAHCTERFVVLDLGSPANVGDLTRLSVTRLDELKRIAPKSQVVAAEQIVAEELNRLEQWFSHRKIAKSIARMVREANLPPQRSTPTLHAKIMRAKAQVAA